MVIVVYLLWDFYFKCFYFGGYISGLNYIFCIGFCGLGLGE